MQLIQTPPGNTLTFDIYLARVCGRDVPAGLYLTQLCYWTEHDLRGDDEGWLCKTSDEWEQRTLLTEDVQRRVRKRLRDLGFIEEKVRGAPPRRHTRICTPVLQSAIDSISGYDPRSISGNPRNQFREIPEIDSGESQNCYKDRARNLKKDSKKDSKKDLEEPPLSPKGGDEYSEKFVAFWEEYPRKVAKGGAWKAWKGGKCEKVADTIIASLPSHPALKKDREYIPHPATFLNGRRWEDDVEVAVATEVVEEKTPAIRSYEEHKAKLVYDYEWANHFPFTCDICKAWKEETRGK